MYFNVDPINPGWFYFISMRSKFYLSIKMIENIDDKIFFLYNELNSPTIDEPSLHQNRDDFDASEIRRYALLSVITDIEHTRNQQIAKTIKPRRSNKRHKKFKRKMKKSKK